MKDYDERNRIISLIILSLLIICVPLFLVITILLIGFTFLQLITFIQSYTLIQGLVLLITLAGASISTYLLYRLVKWLRN